LRKSREQRHPGNIPQVCTEADRYAIRCHSWWVTRNAFDQLDVSAVRGGKTCRAQNQEMKVC
jgi:hypothetical protein